MIRDDRKLKNRNIYLEQLIAFKDKELIKVVTGIRRCGKSSLLKLMQYHLLNNGVKEEQIIAINFESIEFQDLSYKELYEYVKQNIPKTKRAYLFFDELQRVERWEDAINSFRVDFDCDIYITGSNSYLLSSEYSTYLSGRYVEIKMYPLSFEEFIDFHGYRIQEYQPPFGKLKKRAVDDNNEIIEIKDLFDAYIRYGGMPGLADIGLDQRNAMMLLEGLYHTVVIKDIIDRKRNGFKQITDSEILKRTILFLADNIGNTTSSNSISNQLASKNMIQNGGKQGKPANKTIASYIAALKESFLFYEIKRFDIKGKEYLSTLGKYYIVDIGLRNFLLGFRDRDRGHVLENIVYFELLKRGYDVAIGKIDNLEVDFIATKADEKLYIQVTESMKSESVRERELKSLQKIPNNHKKIVLTLDKAVDDEYEGIQSIDVVEWLLE